MQVSTCPLILSNACWLFEHTFGGSVLLQHKEISARFCAGKHWESAGQTFMSVGEQ